MNQKIQIYTKNGTPQVAGADYVKGATPPVVDSTFALWDGTTGRLLKSNNGSIDGSGHLQNVIVDLNWIDVDATHPNRFLSRDGSGTVVDDANPSLVQLQHTHANAANGGTLPASSIASGTVALARGGTNADLSGTGAGFLKQATTGANVTVAALASGDIPNLDASKITTGTLALARGGTNAALSAASRSVLSLFTGDTAVQMRQMGAYEYQPFTVLGADAASVSISSIPTTHNIAKLFVLLRTDRAATLDGMLLRFIADTTAANYFANLQFNSSAGYSSVNNLGATAMMSVSTPIVGNTATAGYFTAFEITIYNYSSTANYKHVTIQGYGQTADTAGSQGTYNGGGVWKNNTTAMTAISIAPQTGTNFKAGSAYGLWLY